MNTFVDIKLKLSNIDNYIIRDSIYRALNTNLCFLSGSLLDVGCGGMPYKRMIIENTSVNHYIGLDIENAKDYGSKPDLTWNGVDIQIEKKVDSVLCTEVLEHSYNPKHLLNEIHKVLKNEGHLFISVPFVWNFHETPYDFFRYTPFALENLFNECGFEVLKRIHYGRWNNFMLQSLGCWLRRGGHSKTVINLFSPLVWFLIRFLKEEPQEFQLSDFGEGSISIGFFYVLKKTVN